MALTAGDVVNRIKALMAVQGVSWNDGSTRDRFKFGGPDTVVTGIATTFMGTFEAITRAAERGLNMIIPHEDTYWNDADNTVIAEADTLIYRTKVDFMAKHNIVVFRILGGARILKTRGSRFASPRSSGQAPLVRTPFRRRGSCQLRRAYFCFPAACSALASSQRALRSAKR